MNNNLFLGKWYLLQNTKPDCNYLAIKFFKTTNHVWATEYILRNGHYCGVQSVIYGVSIHNGVYDLIPCPQEILDQYLPDGHLDKTFNQTQKIKTNMITPNVGDIVIRLEGRHLGMSARDVDVVTAVTIKKGFIKLSRYKDKDNKKAHDTAKFRYATINETPTWAKTLSDNLKKANAVIDSPQPGSTTSRVKTLEKVHNLIDINTDDIKTKQREIPRSEDNFPLDVIVKQVM